MKPEQKQKLVHAYQSEKKVVGMVGDGVNDVLALKDADCGIAMAAGSDAAKQSAHIVLLDSDFACLRNIVSEGRTIIANIEAGQRTASDQDTVFHPAVCHFYSSRTGDRYPGAAVSDQCSLHRFPSFVLTLEHTEEVTSTGFLRHVMQHALPAAIMMVVTLLVVQVLSPFWKRKQKCLPIPLISWSEEQSGSWSYFVCAGR